jgi:hypothetical protein
LAFRRHFLQKSLIKGFEIFGLESHQDSLDYSNVLAWNLEQAIFDKFKTDEINTSNEYRGKVRIQVLGVPLFYVPLVSKFNCFFVKGSILEIQSAGELFIIDMCSNNMISSNA